MFVYIIIIIIIMNVVIHIKVIWTQHEGISVVLHSCLRPLLKTCDMTVRTIMLFSTLLQRGSWLEQFQCSKDFDTEFVLMLYQIRLYYTEETVVS